MPQSWDMGQINFPSEGRHAEDFYVQKNPTASAGFDLVGNTNVSFIFQN
jgi:hypothetical protein